MAELIQRTHSIGRVLQLRNSIVAAATKLLGDSADLYAVADAFCSKLPDNIQPDLVRDSLLHLAGARLTPEVLRENAWRVAGNIARLENFHAVPPWNRQAFDEYVPVQVVGVARTQTAKGRLRYELLLQVLAGTSAPLKIRNSWSPKVCQMLSSSLGFSRPWDGYPLRHPRQFFGLRFYVLVEQQLSGAQPGFEQLWTNDAGNRIHPGSCYTYNRRLIRLRDRSTSEFECPGQFPVEVDCHQCVLGCDRCPLATHLASLVRAECRLCGQVDWCDPAVDSRLCVVCSDKQSKGGN